MTLSYPETARICRGFALLLHSGIRVAEAAFLLQQQESLPVQTLLQDLEKHLNDGRPLGDAMELCGGFPEYVQAMVHIGEETGRLEDTLNALADYYEENTRTLRQIRSAVAYPAIMMVLILLVIGVLLVKVLPVFDRVYASLGSRLTGPAAGLLYAGQLLEQTLPVLFILLLVLAAAVLMIWLRPELRRKLTAVWQKKYGDRGIARKFNNARFARALAMGLSCGMNPEESLTLAETLLKEIPGAARRCADCIQTIEEGTSFVEAIEQSRLLSSAQCRLLQVGSRSGNADRVMETVAVSTMEEARNALEDFISGIEPTMVLISSVLVGLILFSVMLPLADILTVLG